MKTTSIESHKAMTPHKERVHKLILIGIDKIKRGTFREIAHASNLKDEQVWKRLSELCRKGKLRDSGKTKICSYSGRRVTIWELC